MPYGSMSQKLVSLMLISALFLVGCGGHAPHPIGTYMPGDEDKSCNSLYAEVGEMDKGATESERKRHERDVWNIILLATGFLVIIPWFFMDLKNSHEVERDAFKARKRALESIWHDKDCRAPAATEGTSM